ncbi:hypothetical protein [Natronobacterium gregoryi]|uniref:Uncharacterized protein n=2 Tax=Natronobacterium gregoryi TaxID=44930 RepID=L0AL42_NATGS|nr:hypothetical protein [Natronobacterium gregoryi]AFZ74521.1 hypothetical protein Natgr_3401 [Natronobacterium gregoryi SP2]ELY72405.1 hypothetical protein C490_03638 [Natronobacterium gregoryi SP2]PLK21733.1 hypothetical protein CYV19_02540 [Natronobacterium gregoryi SP2]SFI97572.1 hypothetical protein SAMN05443661_110186 [Natronobacterium gregoryi]
MLPVPVPRIAFAASLVVLGFSLATFGTVVGGLSTATAGEVTVTNDTVVFVDDSGDRTPIADATTTDQITVSDESGLVTVTTTQREPAALTDTQREAAARVAVSNATLTERLQASNGMTVDVAPLRADEPVDRQLRRPELATDASAGSTGPTFRPGTATSETVTLERAEPQFHENRALVVVEPVTAPNEYRVVVNLTAETVEQILSLEVVS